jgi:putative SOS response-associated peptidase YedK
MIASEKFRESRSVCGKFTAMASWSQVVAFSQPLIGPTEDKSDREVTFRVMSNLPVIVFNRGTGKRQVVAMRWGFPHPKDWRRPQPIHARAEGIDTTRAFAGAFHDGQRGIVLVKTFNEAPESGVQHTITPGDAPAIGIAFLWRQFEIAEIARIMPASVMVTVPANRLIATLPTDRMPAILAADDWSVWLGEEPASPERVKACLKTVEDVRWTMTEEEKTARPRRKPTKSDPGGLF